MKLFAISDLHVGYQANLAALGALGHYPDDWVILAGDIGETAEQLDYVLTQFGKRFARTIWVPGNHDLWTFPSQPGALRGHAKYERLVAVCRDHGALTPEDPFATWDGEGGPCTLAPIFCLYDYSFRPDGIPRDAAVAWAMEAGVLSADESRLDPAPFASRADWCAERCRITEARLSETNGRHPFVIVSHFPLREDLARTPLVPRFSIWCGTRATAAWHQKFSTKVVVTGHTHFRTTDWRHGVRFEEVSLGYPHQWRSELGLDHYLRQILPGPTAAPGGAPEPQWHP
ncbi:MAG: metallophosphoesterase [Deltaproteobacteria bacterium]|nr:metallophosphoesterase [Deltaproteobacteria bacterium]